MSAQPSPQVPPPAARGRRRRTAAGRPQTPLLLALLLVAVILVLALSRIHTGGVRVPAEGGTLVEAAVGPVTRVNPLDAQATPAERDLAALLFIGLTHPGPDGYPLPALADSWQVSDEAKVFTFHLRHGAVWHDGAEVTAEDVLFTLSALIGMGNRADPALTAVWAGVTVSREGSDGVRVELPQPFAALPAYASFPLLPAHLLRDVPPERLADNDFFRAPVGTGPFQLGSIGTDRARLVRFTEYALGPPYLDGIEFRFAASTRDAGAMLDAGRVMATAGGRAGDNDGRFTRVTLAGPAYTMVLFNQAQPLFQDAAVRRALALATDREGAAMRAGGRPADAPVPPDWWAADGVPPPPARPDEARRILAEAGWQAGADGVLRREGRELAFTLVTPAEADRAALARELAAAWQAVGVRVTVAPADAATVLRDFLAPRAYQAALVGWDPGPDPDPYNAWSASLRGHPDANLGDVADDEIDRLMTAARSAATEEERRSLYRQFAARFREIMPAIVLYAESTTYILSASVHGVGARAVSDPAARFSDVHRWYLKTRRR